MPWYRDLELRRHGAIYVEPELNVAMILADGRSLEWWTDLERTAQSFAQFSARDAAALRRWVDDFSPVVEQILLPEAASPPLPPERRHELLSRSPLGRRLLEVSALSPLEFAGREFEHDVIRAGLLFFNGLREVDLRLKGFGHSIPAMLASPHKAQMCLGGSARLAEALVADIREHGGEVLTGVEPARILLRGSRAIGIELADGRRIGASGFVASGLNPQQTFLQLIDATACGLAGRSGDLGAIADLRRKAEAFRYNLLAPLFALNVAISEPPQYRAAERRPELNRAFMVILGLERFDQFSQIVAAHEQGRIPPTVMWGTCPTLFDPSQAPTGKHTAFMWEKLPYAVHGDPANWDRPAIVGRISNPSYQGGAISDGLEIRPTDTLKATHGRDMLRLWTRYAPNLEGAVLDAFVRSPADTERDLPNMRQGDLLVGSFDDGQVGYHRPFAGAGQYRTPIAGLYLCGGSTHPGGNITGLCGYNAARVIAADLSLRCWWNPAGE
jgi:phytoene dehydrogenase-like protein